MGTLFEGGWARSIGQDRGRIMRLVKRDARTESWLCQVVDTDTGETLYRTDIRIDQLMAIDSETEPLYVLALETLAGPYPYT
jgi:hypothetical protein